VAPNPRLQRTPSAPLSRQPLGDGRRIAIWVFGVTLVATLLHGADEPAERLLGRWRSLETSRGGIGAMLTLRRGGLVEYSIGAVVEAPYRVEGKQLVLPPGTEGGHEQRQTIMWLKGDKLRLASDGGSWLELSRIGPLADASDPLIGEWRGVQDMEGHKVDVLYFFYPKGRGLLLMPFVTQQGSYSTDNLRVHFSWPNCPNPDATFEVRDDVLVLTPPNSKQARYVRY
jgi:hypothetical protein